jgi:hypothetical protein
MEGDVHCDRQDLAGHALIGPDEFVPVADGDDQPVPAAQRLDGDLAADPACRVGDEPDGHGLPFAVGSMPHLLFRAIPPT